MKVNKTLLVNIVLTFAYFFAGALVMQPDEIGGAALVAALAAGTRAAIGVWFEYKGRTLPMDGGGE